ncbi:glyoxalase/bleomycin resistance/dioxygenase family protein (plasmid) [Aquabacterium olei]|uniref:Glyoxalase/bleomycin resistance/dioxygenase family protein n=1 Tax=Aquabacterium olei TaxID=1296669 RepID=A0A2U8FXL9_9BURK|nr:ArsI/CadI family heavy metal resistance metalloenzyme [Aquabacterium olei]AWI55538.1 glyoxalase/bleomycin resistance/dioxygenase family protein [Aquabacterium olei]
MKRFHVHIHVEDLARNIDFYSKMFGVQPARVESDYAKWMLEEPAVNFAISTRGQGHVGLDHLGIQVDDEADLATLKTQAQAADLTLIDEGATTCCYARSDKHWVLDPQGLPWEHFRTLGSIPTFRASPDLAQPASATASAEAGACCTPVKRTQPFPIPVKQAGSACC